MIDGDLMARGGAARKKAGREGLKHIVEITD